jgi:hypothetical protein
VRPTRKGNAMLNFFNRVFLPTCFVFTAVLAGIALFGRTSGSQGQRNPLLSTQAPQPVATPNARESAASTSRSESRQVVLYVGTPEDPTKLMPCPVTLDAATGVKELVDRVIFALQGPFDNPKALPTVPKGTRLLSVFTTGKRLIVNVSRELAQSHVGGTQATRLTLYSIANTLLDLGLAEEIKLLIQGREDPGLLDHLDLSSPITFEASMIVGRRSSHEVMEGHAPETPESRAPAAPVVVKSTTSAPHHPRPTAKPSRKPARTPASPANKKRPVHAPPRPTPAPAGGDEDER